MRAVDDKATGLNQKSRSWKPPCPTYRMRHVKVAHRAMRVRSDNGLSLPQNISVLDLVVERCIAPKRAIFSRSGLRQKG